MTIKRTKRNPNGGQPQSNKDWYRKPCFLCGARFKNLHDMTFHLQDHQYETYKKQEARKTEAKDSEAT